MTERLDTKRGEELAEKIAQSRTWLVLDYDGTLAEFAQRRIHFYRMRN